MCRIDHRQRLLCARVGGWVGHGPDLLTNVGPWDRFRGPTLLWGAIAKAITDPRAPTASASLDRGDHGGDALFVISRRRAGLTIARFSRTAMKQARRAVAHHYRTEVLPDDGPTIRRRSSRGPAIHRPGESASCHGTTAIDVGSAHAPNVTSAPRASSCSSLPRRG